MTREIMAAILWIVGFTSCIGWWAMLALMFKKALPLWASLPLWCIFTFNVVCIGGYLDKKFPPTIFEEWQ